MLVFACYMPPGDAAARHACLDFLENLIVQMKRKYSNLYICLLYTSDAADE